MPPSLPIRPSVHQLIMNSHFAAVFGPAATIWYKFLQNKIKFQNANLTIAARVLTDQCVFATTNMFVFLSSMAIMEGTSPRDKLKSTYSTALAKNWMLWPAVQAVNFKFVPLEHRVLVVNVVSLGEYLMVPGPGTVLTRVFSRVELLLELSQQSK